MFTIWAALFKADDIPFLLSHQYLMGGFPGHHFHILSKKLLDSPFFIFSPASTSLVAEGRVQSNWPFSPVIDETINFLHTSMICFLSLIGGYEGN